MREGTAVEAKDGVLPLASPLFRALSPRGVEAGSRGEVYGRLSAGKYFLDPCDAPQALAALLISLPLLKGDSEILLTSPLPSRPFAEMALSAMARFGVYCDSAGPRRFFVPGRQSYTAADVEVEGDWAAGGAYLASGALGADVAITGLDAHSEQPGAALLKFFEAAGIGALREGGALRLPLSQIRPTDWDVTDCFEAAGTMASLLSVANGRSSLINPGAPGSGRRRRMEGLASLIRDIGGQASVGDRALVIDGVPKLKGGAADSLSDPRIAMAAATCSPACPSDVFLAGPECVSRICKDFWRDFMKAGKGAAGRRPWP
jgi:3-phosphoshikimate 1-carboxyvinyltransferase